MTKAQKHSLRAAKRQKKAVKSFNEGSNEEVLLLDVKELFQSEEKNSIPNSPRVNTLSDPPDTEKRLPERFSEIEISIKKLSSTGDGIGFSDLAGHAFVVPFTVPGDLVKAKIVHHFPDAFYSLTDFIQVLKRGPERNDSLIRCQYFTKCGGCQVQMLSYDAQLRHKKTILENAYRNFSSLAPESVPAVGRTIGSPLQYGYRTKLTPHFDGPPGSMSRRARHDPSSRKSFDGVPPIGFMIKGIRKKMDIEDCPIGTDAVRDGMKAERERVTRDIAKYTKGATLLLRESTSRTPKVGGPLINGSGDEEDARPDTSLTDQASKTTVLNGHESKVPDTLDYVETRTCITNQKATSTEYVDNFIFKNTAGAFFQNNNSILPTFTAYIRNHILPPQTNESAPPLKYLIDAYCGSGLFTITLSSLFQSSMGIDIAETSIAAARENANLNKIKNAVFMTADASKLFNQVTFPAEKTAVVIDPPRKGCDDAFLQQLLRFGPQRVVYVSCNVHTQARDVGVLVEGKGGCRYEIESLQGFDFFPQTGHVEGVAILSRRG